MFKLSSQYDDYEEFSKLQLAYKIEPMKLDSYERKLHVENYDKLQKALKDVGVNFILGDDGILHVSLSMGYLERKRRYAGRREKPVWNEDHDDFIRYSDVLYMLQGMTNKEVAAEIGMPINTFYRHRNKMLQSDYYKSLDKNRLDDKDYLESMDRNFAF